MTYLTTPPQQFCLLTSGAILSSSLGARSAAYVGPPKPDRTAAITIRSPMSCSLRIEAYPALRLADLYCGSERRGVGFGVGVGVGLRSASHARFFLIRSGPNRPRILGPRRVSAGNRYSCC
jgi:hypothetical protein